MATVCHGEPGTREVNCATVPGCVALFATEAGQWKNCGLKDSEKRSPPEPCSSVSLVPSFSSSSSSFFFFLLFRATPAAYRSSQDRGQIRAGAASLHHSHSNMRSEPCL